jgi:hypothetical protein
MTSKAQRLLALAALLPLMGQGCLDMRQGAQVESQTEARTPGAAIDAAVDAELDAAASVDSAERAGDADADLIINDQAELDAYTEAQYELE